MLYNRYSQLHIVSNPDTGSRRVYGLDILDLSTTPGYPLWLGSLYSSPGPCTLSLWRKTVRVVAIVERPPTSPSPRALYLPLPYFAAALATVAHHYYHS